MPHPAGAEALQQQVATEVELPCPARQDKVGLEMREETTLDQVQGTKPRVVRAGPGRGQALELRLGEQATDTELLKKVGDGRHVLWASTSAHP
jgi:hypothetical protein